jgi:aldehyde dehydrogenase (NAD+)/succinate-semialdehyde dehydrogenase/glutarate-semialdehyde dehydrogenase
MAIRPGIGRPGVRSVTATIVVIVVGCGPAAYLVDMGSSAAATSGIDRQAFDVPAAFAAARAAHPAWADTDPGDRTAPFRAVHSGLLADRDACLDIVQTETGKARMDALEELLEAATSTLWYARNAGRLLRPRRRAGTVPLLTRTREYARPHGVVAVITPWNDPLSLAADVVPVLLAGNAVVHKPDSRTVRSSLLLRDLALEAGLDPRLWQVVTGEPAEIGDALLDGADFVSFTGSTTAGRAVARRCADRLIGCSLELGGKNPMIVLGDADLDRAVPAAVRACFANAGQMCIGIERIYVDRGIEAEFLRRFSTATRMLRLGRGLDFTADIGALISAEHLDRVHGIVQRAVAGGARLVTGGRPRPDLGPNLYEPTIVTGAAQDSEIVREEVFGPVVTVTGFGSEAEAIRLANDTAYGLNAAVFGADTRRARSVAARIHAGMVNVNDGYTAGYGSAAPVGGRKQSGLGRRHGAQGLLQYTEPQIVASQHGLDFHPPPGLSTRRYADLLTAGIRLLGRLPRR